MASRAASCSLSTPENAFRESRGGHIEERRLLHERLARKARHHPFAGPHDVMHDPHRVSFIRLPPIAAGQTGEYKREQQPAKEQPTALPGGNFEWGKGGTNGRRVVDVGHASLPQRAARLYPRNLSPNLLGHCVWRPIPHAAPFSVLGGLDNQTDSGVSVAPNTRKSVAPRSRLERGTWGSYPLDRSKALAVQRRAHLSARNGHSS